MNVLVMVRYRKGGRTGSSEALSIVRDFEVAPVEGDFVQILTGGDGGWCDVVSRRYLYSSAVKPGDHRIEVHVDLRELAAHIVEELRGEGYS